VSDGYHLDSDTVAHLDAQVGLPAHDHPLTGPLVTPHDVQRWLDQLAHDEAVARDGLQELAAVVGHGAIVQALVDMGVLVEADRWEDWWA